MRGVGGEGMRYTHTHQHRQDGGHQVGADGERWLYAIRAAQTADSVDDVAQVAWRLEGGVRVHVESAKAGNRRRFH